MRRIKCYKVQQALLLSHGPAAVLLFRCYAELAYESQACITGIACQVSECRHKASHGFALGASIIAYSAVSLLCEIIYHQLSGFLAPSDMATLSVVP
jgi:hypothetical protein